MKTKLFISLALAGMLLTGCEKEDDPNNDNGQGQEQKDPEDNKEDSGEEGGNSEEKTNRYLEVAKDIIARNAEEHQYIGVYTEDFLKEEGVTYPLLRVTNVAIVSTGYAVEPKFELAEPSVLFCVHTYHWDYPILGIDHTVVSYVEDEAGNTYTLDALTDWSKGSGREKVDWWSYPCVDLKPGVYTVRTTSHGSWSHNSESDNMGFCDVYTIPVK